MASLWESGLGSLLAQVAAMLRLSPRGLQLVKRVALSRAHFEVLEETDEVDLGGFQ